MVKQIDIRGPFFMTKAQKLPGYFLAKFFFLFPHNPDFATFFSFFWCFSTLLATNIPKIFIGKFPKIRIYRENRVMRETFFLILCCLFIFFCSVVNTSHCEKNCNTLIVSDSQSSLAKSTSDNALRRLDAQRCLQ